MRYQNNKSTNLIFNKIFFNFHFSITIACKDFNLSQICYLGLGFYLMSKNWETISRTLKHHFLKFIKYELGPK